jgi:hypothetical protein
VLAGVALGEHGWTVFHDDRDWATYPGLRMTPDSGFQVRESELLARAAILAGSLVTAAAAPVACWWEKLEGDPDRWRVNCNGKPVDDVVCNAPAAGLPISVSADGSATVYGCQITPAPGPGGAPGDPRNLWVVSAGKRNGPYRFLWGVAASDDGRHSAWAAADTVYDPWYYVVDGRRIDGPWQHAFPPQFSPDHRSVVWGAVSDPHEQRVDLVVDGRIRARADIIMTPPVFPSNGTVQWAVKRGNSVRRIVID